MRYREVLRVLLSEMQPVEVGVKVDKAKFCADRPLHHVPALYSSSTKIKRGHHSLLCSWDDGNSYFSLQRFI